MDTLIADIKHFLITSIKQISIVRRFATLNKEYNTLCIPHINTLNQYYKNKYTSLSFINHLDVYSKEKFTVEIVLDGLYDTVPSVYYHDNNIITAMFAFIDQLEYLKLAHRYDNKIDIYTMKCAAYSGSLECLQYILGTGLVDTSSYTNVYEQASYLSQIHILNWMYENHKNKFSSNNVYGIIGNKIPLLDWYYGKVHIDILTKCVFMYGDKDSLQWILDKGIDLTSTVYNEYCWNYAMKNLDMLILLHERVEFINPDWRISVSHDLCDVIVWLSERFSLNVDEIMIAYTLEHNAVMVTKWLMTKYPEKRREIMT